MEHSVQEDIIKGLPGFLNELNEMTIVGVLALVVIWLIVREILRARYQRRARSMIENAINGGGEGDSLTSRPIGNPHTSHDPAVLFTWLIEEVRLHRVESDRRFSRLEGKLGELRGELNAMKGGGP